MKHLFQTMLFGAILALCCAGCSVLKAHKDPTRYFVLTSMPSSSRASTDLTLGISRVSIPDYLAKRQLAIHSANEVHYQEYSEWAERLDAGLQRVIQDNMASLLTPRQILLNQWGRGAVQAELAVTVQQFDVDTHGQAVLTCQWQITFPSQKKTIESGIRKFTRTDKDAGSKPDASAASLSALAEEMCRAIAKDIQGTP